MQAKLTQLDLKYITLLQQAESALSLAQLEVNRLNALKEQERLLIVDYFDALGDKAQAELVIANTPNEIKL